MLFPRKDWVILPTAWGCRFILPKKGYSKYLLLSIMTGLYELEWRSYFDSFIKYAKVFIDVGAAADGYYALRAFKKNDQVLSIAIEPLRSEFEYLIKNILINNAFKRIIPLKISLGEKCGEMILNNERVFMLSLDRLVDKLGLSSLDIIKIDVEGAGFKVIKGGLKTISKYRPIIFLEIHNRHERWSLDLLKTLRYSVICKGGRAIAIPS